MLRLRLRTALAALGLLAAVAVAPIATSAQSAVPTYQHIFVIVEENHSYNQIIGNKSAPELNNLAQTYGVATNYYGTIHPSEGNYVAMVGGNTYSIEDDASYTTHTTTNPSVAQQLEAAGLSWKGYFQSMPSPGFTGTCYPTDTCLYASKHNGFMNFAAIQNDPAELAKLVPIDQLATDLASGNIPNFSFIVPDQCTDMHGLPSCSPKTEAARVSVADSYAQGLVNEIMATSTWASSDNDAIVIIFDEGVSNQGCCDANPGGGNVLAVVVANHGPRGVQDETAYNHYSLLATIEQAFGLGCLQLTCDTFNVVPMAPLFQTQ
jgi:phospholipase C